MCDARLVTRVLTLLCARRQAAHAHTPAATMPTRAVIGFATSATHSVVSQRGVAIALVLATALQQACEHGSRARLVSVGAVVGGAGEASVEAPLRQQGLLVLLRNPSSTHYLPALLVALP